MHRRHIEPGRALSAVRGSKSQTRQREGEAFERRRAEHHRTDSSANAGRKPRWRRRRLIAANPDTVGPAGFLGNPLAAQPPPTEMVGVSGGDCDGIAIMVMNSDISWKFFCDILS